MSEEINKIKQMGRKRKNYNITMPTSWNDVTLEQFQNITKLYDNETKPTMLDIISVLTNIEKKELEQYPTEVINVILQQANYVNTNVMNTPSSNVFFFEGKNYRINTEEEMKFKEFVDAQTVLEQDKRNYAAILAIICRLPNEIYDDDFIANKLNERIKMFNEAPIIKITPLINFFLNLLITSKMNMNQYSTRLKELVSKCLDNIETSLINGAGKKHSLKSQMKKLQTLKEQLKCI